MKKTNFFTFDWILLITTMIVVPTVLICWIAGIDPAIGILVAWGEAVIGGIVGAVQTIVEMFKRRKEKTIDLHTVRFVVSR